MNENTENVLTEQENEISDNKIVISTHKTLAWVGLLLSVVFPVGGLACSAASYYLVPAEDLEYESLRNTAMIGMCLSALLLLISLFLEWF